MFVSLGLSHAEKERDCRSDELLGGAETQRNSRQGGIITPSCPCGVPIELEGRDLLEAFRFRPLEALGWPRPTDSLQQATKFCLGDSFGVSHSVCLKTSMVCGSKSHGHHQKSLHGPVQY